MAKYVKVLNKDSSFVEYIEHKLLGPTMKNMKARISDDPQIRQLVRNSYFVESVSEIKSCA